MYNLKELRRILKSKFKYSVHFKQAGLIQKIIDKDRWTFGEIEKFMPNPIFIAPMETKSRNYISDALTFNLTVDKSLYFRYIVCKVSNNDLSERFIIVFSKNNLQKVSYNIRRLSKLKAFL